MNKLLVGNDDDLSNIIVSEDNVYMKTNFNNSSKVINIDVLDNANLVVFEIGNSTNNKITYNLGSNATLLVNRLSIDNNDDITINLNGYGASVTLNNSIICYNNSIFRETINHLASNTKSRLVNHGINVLDKNLSFNINGVVKKNLKDCISNQDNRIMNLSDGNSKIFPNLFVDSNEIDFFHSAYIGNFAEDVVFYLQSRGIDEKNCKSLLIKGFLIGNMELDDSEKDEFNAIIDKI